MFNWKVADKYQELYNFEIEVKKIFMTNGHNTQESEKVPKILNGLHWEELWFLQTLNDVEKEKCHTSMGLAEVLHERFKLYHNETVLSV